MFYSYFSIRLYKNRCKDKVLINIMCNFARFLLRYTQFFKDFMINPIVKTIELPDGRTITLETGKLAKQADGSVMLRMGNTMLLATVCAAKDAVPGTDFRPLPRWFY